MEVEEEKKKMISVSEISSKASKEMKKSQRQRSSSSSPPAPPSDITHHFFKVYMPSSCHYSLSIPNKLVNRDDIDIKKKMVLRDPSQRSWPVNISFFNDRTTFGKGWYHFWKRNNLQSGDQCMFEFNKCKVKGRDENFNVINVKVVRATGKRPSAPHKT